MTEQAARVVSVGEVMIELTRGDDGRFSLGTGGDTFNTAVYLAREGLRVAYATALGDDDHSERIISLASAEGIATDLITRVPGRLPGLYMIETDEKGERSFRYWRDTSPARELFELQTWGVVAEGLLDAQMIYFSGITLSLYSNAALGRFLAVLELARERGVKVAFDSNYRPAGWHGDVARARTVYLEALKRVDLALPSFDDEAALWGDASPDATVNRLQAFGIGEIVVKNAGKDALVALKDEREWMPVKEAVEPVDTTAAGDSFNAGYLAARLKGHSPAEAARAAHELAARVVGHRGAIIPRDERAVH